MLEMNEWTWNISREAQAIKSKIIGNLDWENSLYKTWPDLWDEKGLTEEWKG